jgi:hypothetical protein
MRTIAARFGGKSIITGADEWALAHDGQRVVSLAGPHTETNTPPANTLLVGSRAELEAEIERLGLEQP